MKTPQQIIHDTYDNNPKLKEQLDYYGLTLDDVGIQFIQSNEYHKREEPIILGYSMQDEKVVNCFVSFIHNKTEDDMREMRLKYLGK